MSWCRPGSSSPNGPCFCEHRDDARRRRARRAGHRLAPEPGTGRPGLAAAGAVAAILVMGTTRSASRQRVWQDQFTYWHQTVIDAPLSYRSHQALAQLLFQIGSTAGPSANTRPRSPSTRSSGAPTRPGQQAPPERPLRRRPSATIGRPCCIDPTTEAARTSLIACLLHLGRYARRPRRGPGGHELRQPARPAQAVPEALRISDSARKAKAEAGTVRIRITRPGHHAVTWRTARRGALLFLLALVADLDRPGARQRLRLRRRPDHPARTPGPRGSRALGLRPTELLASANLGDAYRPWTVWWFALQWGLGQGAPWVFHLVNLPLTAGLTVWCVLLGLERWPPPAAARPGPPSSPSIRSTSRPPPTWSARPRLWMTPVHGSGHVDLPPGPAGRPLPVGTRWLLALIFLLGAASKEQGIVLPAVLVAVELVGAARPDQPLGPRLGALGASWGSWPSSRWPSRPAATWSWATWGADRRRPGSPATIWGAGPG